MPMVCMTYECSTCALQVGGSRALQALLRRRKRRLWSLLDATERNPLTADGSEYEQVVADSAALHVEEEASKPIRLMAQPLD